MKDWDKRFLSLAQHIAGWSKDPSTKCGAVIVRGKRIVSLGFNGFPAGTRDDQSLYLDREEKYRRVIHAEQNAMAFANCDLTGCTIYVWPFHPCSQCAAMIVQRGVSRVVTAPASADLVDRWGASLESAMGLLEEGGVQLSILHIEGTPMSA